MKRWPGFVLTAAGFALLFWVFRERSHSGDWEGWIRFVRRGVWFRLREPICLAFYQLPYLAFAPWGATPKGVFAAVSCLGGGLSLAVARETLKRLLEPGRPRHVGLAAVAASFGITGVFFGHVEHYAIMSLGTFVYVHYAVRYVQGASSISAPALALGLLLTTHLMAAWLVPSLALLPWLRGGGRGRAGPELARAAVVVAVPNLLVWAVVVATYFDGSVSSLLREVTVGDFSDRAVERGNSLGGANNRWFLPPGEVFSWRHWRGTLALLFLYSPFAFVVLPLVASSAPRAFARALRESAPARVLLALLAPYLVFVATWEADLGYARDWDLFSHVTIFAVFLAAVLVPAGASGWRRLVALGSLALSFVTTGYLVAESHRPDTPTGVVRLLRALGEETQEPRWKSSWRPRDRSRP